MQDRGERMRGGREARSVGVGYGEGGTVDFLERKKRRETCWWRADLNKFVKYCTEELSGIISDIIYLFWLAVGRAPRLLFL